VNEIVLIMLETYMIIINGYSDDVLVAAAVIGANDDGARCARGAETSQ